MIKNILKKYIQKIDKRILKKEDNIKLMLGKQLCFSQKQVEAKKLSDIEVQKKIFTEQLELAQKIDKPIVFHNRDSDDDIINILSEFPDVHGIAHCFSSTYDVAKKLLDMGYYISFSGNLTFKNSHLPDVAKRLPIDRILVETDSPFLSPAPHRGKTNEPGRARFVADFLAQLHNLSINEIADVTTANAKAIFKFP